jgi:hypothetical protein
VLWAQYFLPQLQNLTVDRLSGCVLGLTHETMG